MQRKSQHIGKHICILERILELEARRDARQAWVCCEAPLLLRRTQCLDLLHKRLACDRLFVRTLKVDALVVQRLVKVARVNLAPYLVPLALRTLPLLVLLLQARQHDRHRHARVVVQRRNHLETVVAAVHLLDNALVDALALPAQARLEAERRALLRIHHGNARRNRL